MSELTEAEVEAYARANSNIKTVMALEIRHSEFPTPVRLVDGNEDLSIELPVEAPVDGGQVVTFMGLKLTVPEEVLDEDPDSQLQVQASGISGAAHEYLSVASKSFEAAQVSQYRVSVNVVSGDVLTVSRQAELEVRGYDISMTATSLSCGFTNTAGRELQV